MKKLATQLAMPRDKAVPAGTIPLTSPIAITKWSAPRPVTKHVWLDETGTLAKAPANNLYEGQVTRLMNTPQQFAATLNTIGPNDCLSYGVPINDEAQLVMTQRNLACQRSQNAAMARTADAMAWPSCGASIWMRGARQSG